MNSSGSYVIIGGMHWDDFRFFLAIAEAGTITEAARSLNVSYSTTSRRLNVLEEFLGARLFERMAAGYKLTEAGADLLESAKKMEAEFEQVARGVIGRDARLSGSLRFATTDALVLRFMPELADFTRQYPEIEIDLLSTPEPAELAMREAEVAMLVTNQPPEVLIGRRLARLPSALYAGRSYCDSAPDFEDLAAHTWIAWDESMRHIPAARWMRENVPGARVVCRVNTGVALQAAVREGVGVAHLLCCIADGDPELRQLRPPEPALETSLWLLTHEDLTTTGRVRVFLDFMADAIGRGGSLSRAS